jgi:dipeptidase E
MQTILLTSTGLSDPTVFARFKQLAELKGYRTVAIITTASEEKSENKYAKLALSQLESLGLSAEFVDLESAPDFDFSKFDVIYVMGGNTFRLLKFAKLANFSSTLNDLFERDGLYVGVSAGTIILSPSIDIANEISPDPNEVRLEDLSSFGLVPFHTAVHYDPSEEAGVKTFEKRYSTRVERISDNQALLINDGAVVERIG